MEKTTVYNLIILDASGSMEIIKQQTINGFNETIQTVASAQKKYPDQNHLLSLVSFNSDQINTIIDLAPISEVKKLNAETYLPDGGTPLYDAIGKSLSKLRYQIDVKKEHQVLVTIITDGEENASRVYSSLEIKKMIEEFKEFGWVFAFIGANIDVEVAATKIAVDNYISFKQTIEGSNEMFVKESNSRMKFFDKISKNTSKKDLSNNYFDEK